MTEGLRVNFSDKEASSEARGVDLLPRGEYHVKITDVEDRECGPDSKNPGKPYWGLEFTVQEGKYEDRKLWTNCMLFEGALYTLSQLMKALGHNISEGEFVLPDGDELVGRDVVVTVVKQGEKKVGDNTYPEKNEVKGIKAYDPSTFKAPAGMASSGAAKGKSSLMP